MQRVRGYIALSLGLMLALTSLSLAAARGQTTPAGAVALCTGAGMLVLHVDADGNPTGPPHVCPDGVAALAWVENPAPVQALHRLRDGEVLRILRAVSAQALHMIPAQARDPPRV